jgi:hypothetical protein
MSALLRPVHKAIVTSLIVQSPSWVRKKLCSDLFTVHTIESGLQVLISFRRAVFIFGMFAINRVEIPWISREMKH